MSFSKQILADLNREDERLEEVCGRPKGEEWPSDQEMQEDAANYTVAFPVYGSERQDGEG